MMRAVEIWHSLYLCFTIYLTHALTEEKKNDNYFLCVMTIGVVDVLNAVRFLAGAAHNKGRETTQ